MTTVTAEIVELNVNATEIANMEQEYAKLEQNLEQNDVENKLQAVKQRSEDIQNEKAQEKAQEAFAQRQEIRDKNFSEKMKNVFSRVGDTVKKVVSVVAKKPVEYVWGLIKQHPFVSLALVLAMVGGWYYFGAVTVGTSGLSHETLEVVQKAAEKVLPSGGVTPPFPELFQSF